MPARSIHSPPACCRSRWAMRPRPSPIVMDGRKIYEFTVTWGEERSTDDLEGEVTQSSDAASDAKRRSAPCLPGYTGVIKQVPPQFSAIKIDGERAYDLARDGETVGNPSREVEIHRLTLLELPMPNTAAVRGRMRQGHLCPRAAPVISAVTSAASAISPSCAAPMSRRSARSTMVPLAELDGAREDRRRGRAAGSARCLPDRYRRGAVQPAAYRRQRRSGRIGCRWAIPSSCAVAMRRSAHATRPMPRRAAS